MLGSGEKKVSILDSNNYLGVGLWNLDFLKKLPADDDPSGHKITGRDNKDSTILMKDHVVSDLLLNQGQPICLQLQCQPVASTHQLIKQSFF